MMILPPYPAPLFRIINFDDMNHTVSVEIFDSNNTLLYNETFDVSADDSISIDRGFDWCPKSRFWFYSMNEGNFTFNVTLDNAYNVSHFTVLQPSKSVWIDVFLNDRAPLEVGDVYRD